MHFLFSNKKKKKYKLFYEKLKTIIKPEKKVKYSI